MTQDSDWGVPEHIDDESDLDFAFRYARKLRESSYPWGADAETALHVSVAEIERLRAENAELRALQAEVAAWKELDSSLLRSFLSRVKAHALFPTAPETPTLDELSRSVDLVRSRLEKIR